MPRLDDDMESHTIAGKGGFAFTGARFDKLGASNYTLVTIAVDLSQSVEDFADDLLKMLKMAIDACKKSPMSDNILVRVIYFSTKYPKGLEEIHGFKLLSDIDLSIYQTLKPDGSTPLYDAVYSSLGATLVYGEQLTAQEYTVNGIFFTITDGDNNASVATVKMIKDKIKEAKQAEKLESLVSILIGINAAQYKNVLEAFAQDAGLTNYIDAGDATPRNLAKLATFVSTSVSSTAQVAGTGGPSQQIAATI